MATDICSQGEGQASPTPAADTHNIDMLDKPIKFGDYEGGSLKNPNQPIGPVKFDYFKSYDSGDEKLEKRAGPVKFEYFQSYDGSGDEKLEKRRGPVKFDHFYEGDGGVDKRAGPVKFDYFKTYDGSE